MSFINILSKTSFTIITFSLLTFSVYAEECELPDLLREVNQSFAVRFKEVKKNERANKMATLIKEKRLDQLSYMSKWKLKRDNQRGPWAMSGNTLIHGVYADDADKWMRTIGKKSFGVGIADEKSFAVAGQGSAGLRIRDKFYNYWDIQRRQEFRALGNDNEQLRGGRTEATFMATDEELDAMEAFLKARVESEIKARRKINMRSAGVLEAGEVIRPEFEITSANLLQESCAGACSSMFSPAWLTHYDAPEALTLAMMAVEKGLKNYTSANALIYSNFRNPNVDAITTLGIHKDEFKNTEDFINNMHWSDIPGMMWGFIPDRPPLKPSPNYTSERISINDWLTSLGQ